MFKLPVYFISDNHFKLNNNPSEKERRDHLYKVFSNIKETGGTLIIGGDFLDFWYDYGSNYIQGYDDIFEALSDLNNSGIKMTSGKSNIILGNNSFMEKTSGNNNIFIGNGSANDIVGYNDNDADGMMVINNNFKILLYKHK